MKWFLILLLPVMAVIFILTQPLTISIESTKKHPFCFNLSICFYHIPVYQALFAVRLKNNVHPVLIQVKKNGGVSVTSLLRKKQKKKEKPSFFVALIKHFSFEKINIKLEIGVEDADKTAILSGIGVALIKAALAFFSIRGKEEKIYAEPYFSSKRFNLIFDCIMQVRIGNIIYEYFKQKGKKHYASNREYTQNIND